MTSRISHISAILFYFLIISDDEKVKSVQVTKEAEYCRLGKQALVVTSEDQESTLFKFDSIHSKIILHFL